MTSTIRPRLVPVDPVIVDGAVLHTLVVAPGPDPAPTLLLRTPYSVAAHLAQAWSWARRGVAVALQDVRGRYGSTGNFEPYHHEREDGARTIDRLRAERFCDGRIIAYGASYAAHCATEAALARDVTGLLLLVPALGHAACIRERTGSPRLLAHASWWCEHGDHRVSRGPLLDHVGWQALDHTPVTTFPEAMGLHLPGWAPAWDRTAATPTVPLELAGRPWPNGRCAPPLAVLTGWHDAFNDDALDVWDDWTGEHATIVIGPWGHDLGLGAARDSTPVSSSAPHVGAGQVAAGWVADLLSGSLDPGRHGIAALERSNRWVPPPSRHRPPTTVERRPTPVRTDFLADPLDPHPALIGEAPVGEVLARQDAARFDDDVVVDVLDVVGRVVVDVHGLGADADVDLDWVVRLVLVARCGPPVQLGSVHTRLRAGTTSAQLMLPAVGTRLAPGDQLVVQVTAHDMPLHPRDPQTGEDPLVATRLEPCRRSVAGPVRLTLPLGRRLPSAPPEPVAPWRHRSQDLS